MDATWIFTGLGWTKSERAATNSTVSKNRNMANATATGSMAGNSKIFNAMIKETGIIKTNYVQEFLDLAGILSKDEVIYPKGKRLGIITNSGGPGALIANNAERKGLTTDDAIKELVTKIK